MDELIDDLNVSISTLVLAQDQNQQKQGVLLGFSSCLVTQNKILAIKKYATHTYIYVYSVANTGIADCKMKQLSS